MYRRIIYTYLYEIPIFSGEEDNTYRIAVSGNRKRQVRDCLAKSNVKNAFFFLKAIIRDEHDRDRATAAAVEIQRVWRGFRIRYYGMRNIIAIANCIYSYPHL